MRLAYVTHSAHTSTQHHVSSSRVARRLLTRSVWCDVCDAGVRCDVMCRVMICDMSCDDMCTAKEGQINLSYIGAIVSQYVCVSSHSHYFIQSVRFSFFTSHFFLRAQSPALTVFPPPTLSSGCCCCCCCCYACRFLCLLTCIGHALSA